MEILGRFRAGGHHLALNAARELCLIDEGGEARPIDRRRPVQIDTGLSLVPVLADGQALALVAAHHEAAWLAHHLRLRVQWGGHALEGRDLAPSLGRGAEPEAFEVAAASRQVLADLLSRWQAVDTRGRGARLSM